MDTGLTPGQLRERGVGSVQFLLACVLALVLFVVLANLVVVQYGRGAIRSALDQGARIAAITGSTAECESRVAEVIGELLGGVMGEGVVARCELRAGLVVATADGVFESWTPLVGDFTVSLSATATVEPS